MCLRRFVLFLSAIAATGSGLQCFICSDFNTDSCTFLISVASCPNGNVCASRYRISIIGELGLVFQNFDRFCAHPSECNATGTFRTDGSTLERMATTCCSTDLCTPEKPIAPDESSEPNGLQCNSPVACMGDETMCLLETTKKTSGSVTVTTTQSGCASKGFCYLENSDSTSGTVREEITYSCTPASGAPYNPSPTALIVLSPLLSVITVVFQYNKCNL
ncbi:uncharacterized protein LOC130293814 [Hyla sarda]|uniref:uncharacterized protein LOC130293814 n=1 Tax=Hyla sarda TaxID=327740 RepID=UPI0024C2ED50|nr:uncharacterized protein LOC130293814 [Hyla sarda]